MSYVIQAIFALDYINILLESSCLMKVNLSCIQDTENTLCMQFCLEPFMAIWSNFQPFRYIWSHLGRFGAIWSHVEPFLAIQSHLELFGSIRRNLGAFFKQFFNQISTLLPTWRYVEPFGAILLI